MKPEAMAQFFLNMSAAAMSQAAAFEHLAGSFAGQYGAVEISQDASARIATALKVEAKPGTPKADPKPTKPKAEPKAAKPAPPTKPAEAAKPAETKPATPAEPAADIAGTDVMRVLGAVTKTYDRSTAKAAMDVFGNGAKFDELDAGLYPAIFELANDVMANGGGDVAVAAGMVEAAKAAYAAECAALGAA